MRFGDDLNTSKPAMPAASKIFRPCLLRSVLNFKGVFNLKFGMKKTFRLEDCLISYVDLRASGDSISTMRVGSSMGAEQGKTFFPYF